MSTQKVDRLLDLRLEANDPEWIKLLDESITIINDYESPIELLDRKAVNHAQKMKEHRQKRDREFDEYMAKMKRLRPSWPEWCVKFALEHGNGSADVITEFLSGEVPPVYFRSSDYDELLPLFLKLANRHIK